MMDTENSAFKANIKICIVLFPFTLMVFGLFGCKEAKPSSEEQKSEVYLFTSKPIPKLEKTFDSIKNANQTFSPMISTIDSTEWAILGSSMNLDSSETSQWAKRSQYRHQTPVMGTYTLNQNTKIEEFNRFIGFEVVDFEPSILINQNQIKAKLFGEELNMKIENSREVSKLEKFWTGNLGKENSTFAIYQVDSIYSASFLIDGNKYELEKSKDDYIIKLIDQNEYLDEKEPLNQINNEELFNDGLGNFNDTKVFIDVLVSYSETARIKSGGTSHIKSKIGLAIVEINNSYDKSNVNIELVPAGTIELAYKESKFSERELKWIKRNKVISDYRDERKADIVVHIVEDLEACGRSYSVLDTNAFSVVKRSCMTGFYSFGHEIGHLMGAGHENYCNKNKKYRAFDYSNAYVGSNEKESWKSIMSKRAHCECQGLNCNCRRPIWSSNIFYDETSKCENNNALTLNQTSGIVSNYRVQDLIQ